MELSSGSATAATLNRLFLLVLLLITGCQGRGGEGQLATPVVDPLIDYAPASCSLEDQNRFVHRVMRDTYLWYQEVPEEIDYSQFDSPEQLLEFLRYSPLDHWSYIVPSEDYDNLFEEGVYLGWGSSLEFDNIGQLRARYIHPGSPAGRAGMRRGDRITHINGSAVDDIHTSQEWLELLGPASPGHRVTFNALHPAGDSYEVTLAMEEVSVTSIFHHDILTLGSHRIGYLMLNEFIEPTLYDLQAVFHEFTTLGIDELIVDLRYNRGGRGDVSAYLADLIWGYNSGKEVMLYGLHNDRFSHLDFYLTFQQQYDRQYLPRVFFLTQGDTCSAAELVINSLIPYMEVLIIGSSTCGKPVGMYGHDFCGKHLAPIELEIRNAVMAGGYYDGLQPSCLPLRDYTYAPFGDADNDPLLKGAIDYITLGGCPPQ